MAWDAELTEEFRQWIGQLSEGEQDDVEIAVGRLEEFGPTLRFPYSSGVNRSRHSHMRELRVQSGGNPIRIFYAFDP
jgi:hypothetical protein